MNKIINGVANDFEFDGIGTFNRLQDPTINELQKQLDKYKNVIDKIKEYIEEVNDDEFYINLTRKERVLLKILELLEEIE